TPRNRFPSSCRLREECSRHFQRWLCAGGLHALPLGHGHWPLGGLQLDSGPYQRPRLLTGQPVFRTPEFFARALHPRRAIPDSSERQVLVRISDPAEADSPRAGEPRHGSAHSGEPVPRQHRVIRSRIRLLERHQLNLMKTLCLSLLLVAVCASVQAGEITGKVAAGKGISVVYVEAVAGKTFPPPDKPLEMDQKSLLFQPHILIGQAGSTVEFLNS